jgi:hypothetical protein
MIGINYGDPFPWEMVKKDEIVYMVDFALQPPEDMLKLHERCHLYWIDHHRTHIMAVGEVFDERIMPPGKRQVGKGACQLAWEYLLHDMDMPLAVKLLARYDVWDFKEGEDGVLPFQWGMRLHETRPEKASIFWARLLRSEPLLVNKIMEEGKVALRFQEMENKKICRLASFETELDGLKAIAVSHVGANSRTFNSVWDPSKYDAMIAFYRLSSNQWTVSIYTDKKDLDVSEIAKARGGGGHAQAAGFQCTELPFNY